MQYKYVIFNELNRYKVPERKLFYKYTTKTVGLNGKINVPLPKNKKLWANIKK